MTNDYHVKEWHSLHITSQSYINLRVHIYKTKLRKAPVYWYTDEQDGLKVNCSGKSFRSCTEHQQADIITIISSISGLVSVSL